jgi:hypothetical protein
MQHRVSILETCIALMKLMVATYETLQCNTWNFMYAIIETKGAFMWQYLLVMHDDAHDHVLATF